MERLNELKRYLRNINFDRLTLNDYKIALEYLQLRKSLNK